MVSEEHNHLIVTQQGCLREGEEKDLPSRSLMAWPLCGGVMGLMALVGSGVRVRASGGVSSSSSREVFVAFSARVCLRRLWERGVSSSA